MGESDQLVGDTLSGGEGDFAIICIRIGGPLPCWISLSVHVLLRICETRIYI